MKRKITPNLGFFEKKMPLERFIPAVFLIFLLFFVALSIITYKYINTYKQNLTWVTHQQEVLRRTSTINGYLIKMPLARRGFVITGDTTYLSDFNRLQITVKNEIKEFKAIQLENGNELDIANKLESRSNELLDLLSQSIEKYQKEGKINTSQIEITNDVEKKLGEIDEIIKEIVNAEKEQLLIRNADLENSSYNVQVFIIITSLFAFIVIGLSLYISIRLIQYKRKTENLLKQSYDELENKVDDRTAELKAANETLKQEINNRINIENSLRESEERFRVLADSSPVLIWMSGEDKLCTYFNNVWLEFTGRSLEQELGNGWTDGIHPEDLQRCLDAYILAFDKRENFEIEFRLKNSYGEYTWVLNKGIPRYEGNKFVGYIGGCINIHERKKNERYLKIQHAVSKTLAEANTIEETCIRVLENICSGVNWEFGILWMVDENKNKLFPESTWSANSLKAREFVRVYDKYVEKGKDLPGLVWATGRSMWLMDIIYDKNFERKEIASKLGWNSAFAIPITNGYEIIAVVECLNQDILTPKADLLEVLESIGRQIGNYLERKKAENKLKQSYAELENRVKDRTVELATTLNKLLAEIEYKEKIQGRLKLFAHAIRGIKECVYITDLENNTLFVNAAFESIYGYQEDELKDKEIPVLFSDIISKEARTKILSSTLKTGWSGELKNKRKDGSEFFIHLSTSVIRNEDGKIQAIVGICQDINELKAAEQLIIKRNSLLKLLNDIIIITNKSFDLKSSITYAINKVCQYTLWDLGHCYLLDGNVLKSTRIWNYDADSKYNVYQQESEKIEFEKGSGLPGKTLESSKSVWLSLKDMNKKTFRRIEVASDASLKTIICVPIMKQTRAIGVLEFFKTEEETIDKEVLECISNIGVELGSLAERIEILEQIKISERQFKAVSDTANDAIVTINQQGKIIYLNSSTEKIFGYSENKLINKELSLLIPGKYIDRYKAAFKKAFASGELILQGKTFEFSGKHKSGNEFPIELSLAKWEINNETFITAMVKDITLRKEIEKELLEKQKMLEEAQQIAKLGSWEWDIKNNIFSWSDELYSIYETNRKQFNPTYEGFLGRIHPEDVEGVKAIIQKAFENKESFSYDHRILTPSGKIKILKAQGEVYTDDEGNVNRLFGTTLDITELRKTEEKVRESERQLKNAQKIAKLGSWKYSLKENIVYWSDEIYNIFEIDTSENPLFNETFLEYVVPEDKPELEVAMKKALEGKKPYAYEYRIRTKSGNMKYLKTQGEIHLDIDNEIDYIVGTVIDITDIKKAEIKIRESEKQLKQAQKIARLGSWEWSLKNDKIKWSDEIYEIFQVEPGSEIKVKQFDSMISEEDKAVRDKLIDEAIKFGKPFNFFFRIKLNNGKTKILNSQAEAYKDKLGNVNRLIGTIMDVTDIKQAEEKIKKNERQLKEAQKIAKLGSWEIDLQSGESICSDELYRIYEVAPNNPPPIYNNIRSIIHPDDLTMVDEMVSMLSNSPKPVQFDYRIITDTGKLKYLTCDILVEFNDSKPVRHYGSVQDITDIKLVEEKLRKTNEKLLEAQKELIHNEKLAALGRFSSGIAHEIRNPLANISALSQLLSKADLDEKSRKHLKYILVNADIANKIIKDLLNFASPEDLSFRKEKIDEFLENVLESVEPRCLENNVNIIRCISNDLPKINIDKLKLENAFMNFISNALDAMPRGGELKVEVQKDKFQKELIITISDTGVGIAPENLDKILEPFYTTKEYGTGLGLGMAYQTIKLHQGTVKIDSSLGNGTTVEIKLPFSRN